MDIEFWYGTGGFYTRNGHMVIHVENFLAAHNVTKTKKLIRLIRQSCNPECEQVIKDYVTGELDQFDGRQLENRRYITGYEQKIGFLEKQIENCTYNRERYKKKSDGWKHYNEHLKAFRAELQTLKADLTERNRAYNKNIRDKEFYKKVLEMTS